MTRYDFNGLYCPKADDFLKDGAPDVTGFLDACCVRLERMAPEVPQVASLVMQMRRFAQSIPDKECDCGQLNEKITDLTDELGKAASERDGLKDELDECESASGDLEAQASLFDTSIPE